MKKMRITHIRKKDNTYTSSGITHYQCVEIFKPTLLGGNTRIGDLSPVSIISKEDAIKLIEAETHSFCTVENDGKEIEVIIVDDRIDGKYLRTYANGKENDNLLKLQEF